MPSQPRSLILLAPLLLSACGESPAERSTVIPQQERTEQQPLFLPVPASRSGIDFANHVTETHEYNYFNYEYMYNGGGVAIGDINNDGLPDIYFTGNMVPDKLYLNKGGLQFEDITATALPVLDHQGWRTGVTMADVNGDGLLDIYVCRAGWYTDGAKRSNLLYINNGDLTFTEAAEAWGIADTTRSTQAAFFDMDGDGDLDLYVANTPIQTEQKLSNIEVARLIRERATPTDRLYRNDGGRFTDITWESGIGNMGYGLGLAISDLNGDGLPDIYVANDYIERDFMYINQGGGRFKDEVLERTRHISNFGMGCDVADYDNDGLPDIVVLDMVSADHVRSKKNMGAMSPDQFWLTVKAGYHHQYMFNTLQRNNGNGTFSELGQLAGISKTDWSWAPLLADLDNDGHKDLLITNGYKRDMRDNDYIEASRQRNAIDKRISFDELMSLIPATRIRNYLFRNNGDLTFSDVSEAWGFHAAVNSNGAAYADLDGDGDLDLVINNIDEKASVFENRAVQQELGGSVRVALEGAATGLALGAKVELHANGTRQFQELTLTRGYQSSVEPILHFGVGKASKADSLLVTWPDGRLSVLYDLPAGEVVQVARTSAGPARPSTPPTPLFASLTPAGTGLDFVHRENTYDDFKVEVLLPHKQSENGPLMSVADVNGDGLDDLFIGGARGQMGTLYLQRSNGTFQQAPSQPWTAHRASEDLGQVFFDANGDGYPDLLITSGSNEVDIAPNDYGARLYLNDGKGNFTHAAGALPALETSPMRAVAADVNGNGHMDLFIGGRVVPGQYPRAPRSYLLINDGNGRFADMTAELAPGLIEPGLVTGAAFLDHDGDGDPDLFLVGEWMPLMLFENRDGHFVDRSADMGLSNTTGWWSSVTAADVDGDGRMDLICGNIGWNNKFQGKPGNPLHVYWGDFDNNGRPDIVLAKDQGEVRYPIRGRECSSEQMPSILERFPTYDAFAHASVERIYGNRQLGDALHLKAEWMKSVVLLNQGDGRFTMTKLPMLAQSAPIRACIPMDVNGDGHLDLVVAGNMWGAEVETMRYDAGTGLVLLGDGSGAFDPMPIPQSGFFAWHDVRDLALVHRGAGKAPMIVVANNDHAIELFQLKEGRPTMAARR